MSDSLRLEDQIVIALRRITRAIDLRSRDLLQFHGLTAPQLAVLQAIGQPSVGGLSTGVEASATPGEIARRVHLGQPTVTGILDRLGQRGLIARARGDRDKRSQNISLSEAGRKLLQEAPSPLQDTFRQELSRLPEWERTQILATLQRIADMMQRPSGETQIFITASPLAEQAESSAEAGGTPSVNSSWTEVPRTLR
jgi:DNA-binding MarR family transcriptional regulator